MITITVDLRDASKSEAEAYVHSKTRRFLLDEAGQDLGTRDSKVTFVLLAGDHFVERLDADGTIAK